MRLLQQIPDPGHFWIRMVPRPWPGPEGPWLDLATSSIGRSDAGTAPDLSALANQECDDLLYVPPVPPELGESRDLACSELISGGSQVLVQLRPGESCAVDGALVVFDLLQVLLEGDLEPLARLQPGSAVAWPLIAGVTDTENLWESGLDFLRTSGVECVQGVSVHLSAAERRRISESFEADAYERLFHGPAPSEREFARRSSAAGFRFRIARPLPGGPARLRSNRRLAEALVVAGDLWLRLHRGEVAAQALFSAARRVDGEAHDLGSLCREGNLGVVPWLDPASSELIEEIVASGRSSLVDGLESEYLARSSPARRPPCKA